VLGGNAGGGVRVRSSTLLSSSACKGGHLARPALFGYDTVPDLTAEAGGIQRVTSFL
jgi:hypothetical protein